MKKEKIVLKGGYVKTEIEEKEKFFQEIKRGTGVQKPKKGKGSYKRNKNIKNDG